MNRLLASIIAEKKGIKNAYTLKKYLRYYTMYGMEKASRMVLDATPQPTVTLIQTTLKNNKKIDNERQTSKNQKKIEQDYGFTRELLITEGTEPGNDETISKLIEMKMSGMTEAYKQQSTNRNFKRMSFDDCFSLMIDIENVRRQSNKLQRLTHQATFDVPTASIEENHHLKDRKLPKEGILKLASGLYLQNHHNIILMSVTGAGKTYLVCSLGVAKCRQLYKMKYVRLPELLDEFQIAKSMPDDSYKNW